MVIRFPSDDDATLAACLATMSSTRLHHRDHQHKRDGALIASPDDRHRPRPACQKPWRSLCDNSRHIPPVPRRLLLLLYACLLFCQGVNASVYEATGPIEPTVTLLFDTREPPSGKRMAARQAATTSTSQSGSSTDNASASNTAIATATTSGSISLPSPFDTSIGNNFTSTTCPQFFTNFLGNSTFESCYPLSLLLQTSSGFFSDSHSASTLSYVLQATCSVDFPSCSVLMSSLATQITQKSNCGDDYDQQNPVVLEAYNGFLAYQPLYHAGCLTDSNGSYCYTDAVTNASSPSSSYVYYLPLDVSLPSDARPACTTCLKNTMAVFAQAVNNGTKCALSKDYAPAAKQIDSYCGASFANTTVKSLGASHLHSMHGVQAALALMGATIFVQNIL